MIMGGDLVYALRPWEQEGSIPSAPPSNTTEATILKGKIMTGTGVCAETLGKARSIRVPRHLTDVEVEYDSV